MRQPFLFWLWIIKNKYEYYIHVFDKNLWYLSNESLLFWVVLIVGFLLYPYLINELLNNNFLQNYLDYIKKLVRMNILFVLIGQETIRISSVWFPNHFHSSGIKLA